MKKLFFYELIMLLIMVMSISACTKDESQNSNQTDGNNVISFKTTSIFAPEFLVNENNPYDRYGISMCAFYTDLSVIFQDTTYANFDLFKTTFNALLLKHSASLYPSIDTSSYSEYESIIISTFTENVYLKNIKKLSFECETAILADKKLSSLQKQRLLAFVSLYKFSYYYQTEIMLLYATWEERQHDCMVRELNEIFQEDGNPWPEAEFIAGCPESVLWMEVSCAWEATFLTK